jgi:hypothetical protein
MISTKDGASSSLFLHSLPCPAALLAQASCVEVVFLLPSGIAKSSRTGMRGLVCPWVGISVHNEEDSIIFFLF